MRVTVNRNGYCVYFHRVEDKIVYIGKGLLSRAFEVSNFARNEIWMRAFSGASTIDIEIVHWCTTEEEAFRLEKEEIIKHQPIGNLTFTEATRSRRRALMNIQRGDMSEEVAAAANFRALLGKSLKGRRRRTRRRKRADSTD